eukprot:RCo041624
MSSSSRALTPALTLVNQRLFASRVPDLLRVARRYHISEAWLIPPLGYYEHPMDARVDLMFTYNPEEVPSVVDVVNLWREVEDSFAFPFAVLWHCLSNVLDGAARAEEGPYF